MKRICSALGWLLATVVLCAMASSSAVAQPTINNARVEAGVDGDGIPAGTENTFFVFRADVAPAANQFLLNVSTPTRTVPPDPAPPTVPQVWIRLTRPDAPEQGFAPLRIDMVRDFSVPQPPPGQPAPYIAFVQGRRILNPTNPAAENGIGSRVEVTWSIIARDTSTGGTPPGFQSAPKPATTLRIYPSRVQDGQPSITLTPVDPNGADDKAPGPGQQGNGLRVDPEDSTSPNDGGGAHFYTWRVRVQTRSGLPPAFFQLGYEWNFNSFFTTTAPGYRVLGSGVMLVLTDELTGQPHYCPMEIDPTVSGQANLAEASYVPQSDGTYRLVGGGIWRSPGVIYRYRMIPSQYRLTQFGAGVDAARQLFTLPDGLGALPLGGDLDPVIGRPIANEYAAFAGQDRGILPFTPYPLRLSPFPPPPHPLYTNVALRAGDWRYYYTSTVDYRPNLGDPDSGANFRVRGWLPERVYIERVFGTDVVWISDASAVTQFYDVPAADPNVYVRLIENDDYFNPPHLRSTAYADQFKHPTVTPILSDGGWTDDLPENNFLQPYTAYLGTSNNAHRSRVTNKTKVRFQVRVTRARDDVAPILVRVFIGDERGGGMRAFTMAPRADIPGNNDYTRGVIYFYDTTFPPGQEGRHAIYFEADDGVHKAIWPRRFDDDPQGATLPNRTDPVKFGTSGIVGKNYLREPWVNHRPILSNPSVTPPSGVEAQPYRYRVTFTDPDDDEPMDAWVVVDGIEYRMTPDPNQPGGATRPTSQGRDYILDLTQLPTILGTHTYYFRFRDNWAPSGAPIRREFGEWTTLPVGDDAGNPSSVIQGPTIVSNKRPELTDPTFTFNDPAQNPATLYDFFVRYKDADNEPPASIKLFMSNDDGVTYDGGTPLVPAEASTNYITGVVYHLPTRIRLPYNPAYKYRFKFVASDGNAHTDDYTIDPLNTRLIHVGTGLTSLETRSARRLVGVAGSNTVYGDPIEPTKTPPQTKKWWNGGTNPRAYTFIWIGEYDPTATPPKIPTLLRQDIGDGTGGDYTVDHAEGTITLKVPNATGAPIWASYYYEETLGPTINANRSPVLEYPDPTDKPGNYKTVSPQSGTPTTSFEFKIIYKDADNQAPVDDAGTGEAVYAVVDNTIRVPLARDPATPIPVDYRRGVTYLGSTTLVAGTHSYHFEATDGANSARRPDPARTPPDDPQPELPGPVVTNIGSLTNATILPFPKGKSDQLYSFTVTYSNTDGLAPQYPIEVRIKESDVTGGTTVRAYTMNPIDPVGPSQFQAGVRYQYTTTAVPVATATDPLDPGTHEVTFGFQTQPAATPVQNLIVNGVPVLTPGTPTVTPDYITRAGDVTFAVIYKDANGDPPNPIELVIDGVARTETPTTTPANPTTADFKTGVTYRWTIPASRFTPGTHTYQFRAIDRDTPPGFEGENAAPVPATPAEFVVHEAKAMTLTEPSLGDPATNNGTLTPLTGSRTGTYTYKVKYTHGDNLPPKRIQLLIDPGAANQQVIDLSPDPSTPSPPPYSTGVIYTYVAPPNSLDFGPHTYRFEAEDAISNTRLPKATDTPPNYPGPQINYVPVLANGTVFIEGSTTIPTVDPLNQLTPPVEGTILDKFIFRVTYSDQDNRAPGAGGYVRVVINGTQVVPMKAVSTPPDYQAGVVYETDPMTLTAGVKTFHFEAHDGIDPARFPTGTEDITGLTVRNILQLLEPTPGDVATNNGTANPLFVAATGQVTFAVKYKHEDGTPPFRVQVMIDPGPNQIVKDLSPPSGTLDFRAGVIYTVQTAPGEIPPGTHTYLFEAQDSLYTTRLPLTGAYGDAVNGKPIIVNAAPRLSEATAFLEGATTIPTLTATNGLNPPVGGNVLKKFIFRVKYTDPDGKPPAAGGYIRAVVSGASDVILLTPKAGDPLDYAAGVVYESAPVTGSTLGAGIKTFHYEASDGIDTARLPAGTAEITGLTVFNLPVLEAPKPGDPTTNNGTLTPVSGPVSTDFLYQILYKNPDGTAPQSVRVIIDGTAYDMTRTSTGASYTTGYIYEYKHRFPADRFPSDTLPNYRFEAVDTVSTDYTARYPEDGSTITGPTVNAAAFEAATFNPNPGILGASMTISSKLVTKKGTTNDPRATGVKIQLVRPDGTGVNDTTNTAADGSFSYTFTPEQTGDWKVRFLWDGVPDVYDPFSAEFPFKVTGYTLTLNPGLDMIASPILPITTDPSISFAPTKPDGTPVNVSVLDLILWSPASGTNGRYLYLNRDGDFPGILAGQAYWTRPGEQVVLNPKGRLADQTQPYRITLLPGWNMIGSVYLKETPWGATRVIAQGREMSLNEAGAFVRPIAWTYEPPTGSYRVVGGGDMLKPGRGYWVRAFAPCDILLAAPGKAASISTRAALVKENALQILARTGDRMDQDNYVPLSGSGAGRMALMEKPPYLRDYVSVRFVSNDDVTLPGDTRTSTVSKNMVAFEVVTDRKNADVSLQFPNVSVLGRKYDFTLVDLATGTRRSLGTNAGYTFQTGDAEAPRRFALLIEPRTMNSALVISAVRAQSRAAGAMTFTYNLSASASVSAQIVSASGEVVRDLASGRAVTRGANSLLWDGKNGRGVALPAGAYLLRLKATDDRGRSATAVLPITLVR